MFALFNGSARHADWMFAIATVIFWVCALIVLIPIKRLKRPTRDVFLGVQLIGWGLFGFGWLLVVGGLR